jgi:hypothetical protein
MIRKIFFLLIALLAIAVVLPGCGNATASSVVTIEKAAATTTSHANTGLVSVTQSTTAIDPLCQTSSLALRTESGSIYRECLSLTGQVSDVAQTICSQNMEGTTDWSRCTVSSISGNANLQNSLNEFAGKTSNMNPEQKTLVMTGAPEFNLLCF